MKPLAAKIVNYRNLAPVGVDGTMVAIISFIGTGDGVLAVCLDGDSMLRQVPVSVLKILPLSRAEIMAQLSADHWWEGA